MHPYPKGALISGTVCVLIAALWSGLAFSAIWLSLVYVSLAFLVLAHAYLTHWDPGRPRRLRAGELHPFHEGAAFRLLHASFFALVWYWLGFPVVVFAIALFLMVAIGYAHWRLAHWVPYSGPRYPDNRLRWPPPLWGRDPARDEFLRSIRGYEEFYFHPKVKFTFSDYVGILAVGLAGGAACGLVMIILLLLAGDWLV
jgi:hypothetical protein